MFEVLGKNQTLAVVGLVILVPLVVYRANARQVSDANPLEKLVLTLTSPIERALSFGVGAVSDTYAHYVDAIGARAENIELRQKMRKMSVESERARGLELENFRLRRLLAIEDQNPTLTMVAAKVVAAGRSPFSRTVRLDRGQLDGIVRGAPVLSESGLVGRVQRVAFRSSEVVLLTDERVSVDVALARSGARGRLRGGRSGEVFGIKIRGLLRTDDVRVGDLVVTSGLAGIFPRAMVVGRVSRAETNPGAQEPQVDVAPEVDFDRLDDVLVILGHKGEGDPVFTPPELLPPELSHAQTSSATEPRDGGIP